MTRLGVIGTGTIASAIVRGLNKAPSFEGSIVLSPRNSSVAAQLSAEFPTVVVGGSNQDVLHQSEIVLLTLRPNTAAEIIAPLQFRPNHQVISAVAALSHERLMELVAPATAVVKAIPLPTVEQRSGITVLYPNAAFATNLFDDLGSALPVQDESQFRAMSAVTSIVASYALFAEIATSWLSSQGLESSAARSYVTSLLMEIMEGSKETSAKSFAEIADSHATKGGLNEQLRNFLEAQRVFHAVPAGLDQVLARVAGTSGYATGSG